jgi:hypothetical protein
VDGWLALTAAERSRVVLPGPVQRKIALRKPSPMKARQQGIQRDIRPSEMTATSRNSSRPRQHARTP